MWFTSETTSPANQGVSTLCEPFVGPSCDICWPQAVTPGLLLPTTWVMLQNKASEHHCPPLDNTITAGQGNRPSDPVQGTGIVGSEMELKGHTSQDSICLF